MSLKTAARLALTLFLGLAGPMASAGIKTDPAPCAETALAPGCLFAVTLSGFTPLGQLVPVVMPNGTLLLVGVRADGTDHAELIGLSLEDGTILSFARLGTEPYDASWAEIARDGSAVVLGDEAWPVPHATTFGADGGLIARAEGLAAEALHVYFGTNVIAFDADGTLRLDFDVDGLPPLVLGPDMLSGGAGPELSEQVEGLLAGYTETWLGTGAEAVTGFKVDGSPSFVEVRPQGAPPLRLAAEPDLISPANYSRPVLSPDDSRLAVTYWLNNDPAGTQLVVFDTSRPGAIWRGTTGEGAHYAWAPDGRLVVISPPDAARATRITVYRP
jgi:hypothetical protein